MKVKVPDVPRDENKTLCWKQEVNAFGNLVSMARCTKRKGHDTDGHGDPLHSWEHGPDPNSVSQMD